MRLRGGQGAAALRPTDTTILRGTQPRVGGTTTSKAYALLLVLLVLLVVVVEADVAQVAQRVLLIRLRLLGRRLAPLLLLCRHFRSDLLLRTLRHRELRHL
eukprot:TRINITY_DN5266_c3_g1_i1.p1 TRINITY_DN5266_c3_g1~~TRINITY_DN5266_c3_g1_i1.p1  ORF type:complete len:101 (+),score=1.65 TRINITY_DN5266_c3_g1_i1:139-441(+)